MRIWLINPYGSIPDESWRDYSFTSIANALTSNGHEVVWWTSNFSHHFKHFRSNGWLDINVNPKFRIRLVPTTGYKKNVGLGRIFRDIIFGLNAYRKGKHLDAPDCIFYSESPLSLGYAGFMLARHHKCPVIFHQMDLWPELMEGIFPIHLRFIAKIFFSPIYLLRRLIYSKLSAVTALAKPYLEVPLNEAPILKSRPNAIIYNGIDVKTFRKSLIDSNRFEHLIPERRPGEVRAVFAGSLGPSYDIKTLLEVAKLIDEMQSNIKIIIAGDGPLRILVEAYISKQTTRSLIYVGKLTPNELGELYAQCDIGLCSYTKQSNVEMPDKIYDYTAAGLAVINSLCGEVSQVIKENQLGLQYEAGNVDDLFCKLRAFEFDANLLKQTKSNSFGIGMNYDVHCQHQKLVDLIEKINLANSLKVSN